VGPVAALVPVLTTAGRTEALIDRWEDGRSRDRAQGSMESVFADEFVHFTNGPLHAADAPPYRELVYSFDYGSAHFAFVLTNYWYTSEPGGSPGRRPGILDARQLAWLKQDLAAARKRGQRHLFVLGYEPGFPCGGKKESAVYWSGSVPEVTASREEFWKVLGEAHVVAYLCGGENNYSRLQVDGSLVPGMSHPVWQIVSGGAGAAFQPKDTTVPWSAAVASFTLQRHVCLFTVDGPRVEIHVVGKTGGTIERTTLAGG
jgi:hypothetical protein